MNRFILIVALVTAFYTKGSAQTGDFCEGVNTVIKNAETNFTNIQGRMMESNATATMWASTVKVPGSIGYRIVNSMGFFYESAFVQTTNKEELMAVYEDYNKKLSTCLIPLGYKQTYQKNFTQEVSDYKKVVFMKEVPEGTPVDKLPPHITMEATYSRDLGKYTIVMFIFNH